MRGVAHPGSDIDLGVFYSESDPFSIQCIRELAGELNDTAAPVVCGFYEWGQWVNGGAWLTFSEITNEKTEVAVGPLHAIPVV